MGRRCSEEELTINNWVRSVEAYKAHTARLDPADFESTARSEPRPALRAH